jgi:MFS family permease
MPKHGPQNPTEQAATPSRAWLILAVLLLFSIAAPLNQFKVPPIMPLLMEALGLSVGRSGLLMSVFAVTGLILALPSGFIFQKVGHRATGLLAGGSIVIGAALGALSQGTGVLLISRVIEGIGTSFMAVLAPAIIAQWFSRRHRGTAMGIWSAWVPVGTAAMLILAPWIAQASDWHAVWWLGAGYALTVTLLYLAFVRPARSADDEASAARAAPTINAVQVLRNRDIWLLAAAFGAFNAAVIGFGTYMPTFLTGERGLSLSQASLLSSVPTLITIFSAPAGGLVSDSVGSRKKPFLLGLGVALVLFPLVSVLNVIGLIVLVIVQGLFFGLIPTNIFAAAVEAAGHEKQGGMAMAMIMVGQNGGMLLGPVIFGALAEGAGWSAAFISLSGLAALGFVAGWLAKVQ